MAEKRVNIPLVLHTEENGINGEKKRNGGWVEAISWEPRVFLYHGLLTPEECDYLVKKCTIHFHFTRFLHEFLSAESRVERSTVVGQNGRPVVDNYRTSFGYFIQGQDAQDPLVKDIERRIAEWTHLPPENGEAFYVLRYEVGQQYKPHTDYFGNDNPDILRNQVGQGGDRIATVVICLHGPDEGGETVFPQAKISVPCTTVCNMLLISSFTLCVFLFFG